MMSGRLLYAAPIVAVILLLPTARGAAVANDEWTHTLTPYIWAAGIRGESGVRNTVAGDIIADIDLSFSDIVDRLDSAFLMAYRAEKNETWALIGDLTFLDISDDGTFGPLDVDVDVSQLIATFYYSRKLTQGGALWWYGGARYMDVDSDIDLRGSGPVGVDNTLNLGESWVDAVVGLQWRHDLGKRWHLGVMADYGTGGSENTIHALGEAGVDLTKRLRLRFGYRWLDIDYDDNDFVLDGAIEGAIIGLAIRL